MGEVKNRRHWTYTYWGIGLADVVVFVIVACFNRLLGDLFGSLFQVANDNALLYAAITTLWVRGASATREASDLGAMLNKPPEETKGKGHEQSNSRLHFYDPTYYYLRCVEHSPTRKELPLDGAGFNDGDYLKLTDRSLWVWEAEGKTWIQIAEPGVVPAAWCVVEESKTDG